MRGKRPSCTRLKDLDSAGMEKFDYILTAYSAMSTFPRRHVEYQDFNNVHVAGFGGKEKKKQGNGKEKKKRKTLNKIICLRTYMGV